ncbi:metallopeptidase TldD-related protein [Nakamurella leprariae]|uniref:TldD/PmbA family protein n=1 Tax=Nakamurella leprariae TaxID=2803911 RepID=A0A938YEL0_9ACTN|nr:metallopeptidase TldD-related protein [Nakamurella leprariae]MBM9466415.1 TldD/PmbA family protein [Nakamurella leprariae]
MSHISTPQQLVEAALAAAATEPGECIVVVQPSSQANLRWANNTATTNGMSTALDWWVVAVVDGAVGTVAAARDAAGASDSVTEVVVATHRAARDAAGSGRARDEQPLIRPEDAAGAQDFDLPPEHTSFDAFTGLLPTLRQAFDTARRADRILYGFARHEQHTVYLGTSTGVRVRWVQPTGTVELNAKSADLTRSSWAGVSAPEMTGIDIAAMAVDLDRRLEWARRTVDLPAGRYDTALPPTAVADFLILLAWGAGARAAHEGRSAFSAQGGATRLGERLTGLPLTLAADPADPTHPTAPFLTATASSDDVSVFDNGAPIGRLEFLRDGVLSGLIRSRADAAEFGGAASPFAGNLALTGGQDGRDVLDLVAGMDRGLLVTSQWYLREVDPQTMLTTGVTRDGVFLVEGGEVVGATPNYRFNMSPLDVLRQAEAVGATVPTLSREWSDWFTRTAMPPMLVRDFNMSSVSQAQ